MPKTYKEGSDKTTESTEIFPVFSVVYLSIVKYKPLTAESAEKMKIISIN